MGGTSYAHGGRDTVACIKEDITGNQQIWKWIDHALVGSVLYAVVETSDAKIRTRHAEHRDQQQYIADPDGSFRFVVVCLVRRGPYELYYKDMDESMGPTESRCPARLIHKASPLRPDATGYAADWRARCGVIGHQAALL